MYKELDPLLHSQCGKKPRTTCKKTSSGIEAFEKYVETLKSYIGPM
ncbi:MAG: transcriptional regulator [Bacteroidales bacterium]|nr:transcriptional regulator [Bacteroidales bacterium]